MYVVNRLFARARVANGRAGSSASTTQCLHRRSDGFIMMMVPGLLMEYNNILHRHVGNARNPGLQPGIVAGQQNA